MFIGHYGVSFAIKRYRPQIPMWILAVAVQFLDILFFSFVLFGIEKMRIVPGFTKSNPYDLYYMPFSHSLAGSFLWALIVGFGFAAFGAKKLRGGLIPALVGGAVFSHFFLDFPMHTPDLPVWISSGGPKLGLGLWNHPYLSTAAELAALFAGGGIYLKSATIPSKRGKKILIAGFVFLTCLLIATPFMPDPPNPEVGAIEALSGYLILAALTTWMDAQLKRKRA